MTVEELISQLMELNPDEDVVILGVEGVEYLEKVGTGEDGIVMLVTKMGEEYARDF
jgi:hypothetical protein